MITLKIVHYISSLGLRVSKHNLSKRNKISCKITTLIKHLLNTSKINHTRLEKNTY
jgi:hypothetical protein